MAKDKRSFILYSDIHFTVLKLKDEQAGKLFKHILSYVNDENPIIDDVLIEIAFEPIKQALKRDLKRYEAICLRNKDNGSKGGRPKSNPKKPKKPSGLIANPNNPDEPDNDSDIDSGNVKEEKNKYADFVSMTEGQYKKLITKHGEHNTKILIDILNNYKGSNGKKYKDDYLAILNWVVDKAKQDGKFRTL